MQPRVILCNLTEVALGPLAQIIKHLELRRVERVLVAVQLRVRERLVRVYDSRRREAHRFRLLHQILLIVTLASNQLTVVWYC